MKDSRGRLIDYMRISITDRCNLRCRYCAPDKLPALSHDDILRYEELLKICAAAANTGIRHFRVTGGEPLVRKGCVDFIRMLKTLPGVERVTMTTNGTLLKPYINELQNIGIDGVNISIDSLDRDTYRRITGGDMLSLALESLTLAVKAGIRVKVNCVIIKDINECEIPELAALAKNMPVDVRFIGLMPTTGGVGFSPASCNEALRALTEVYPDLTPDDARHGCGPARYYKSKSLAGGIGFISAFESHFCGSCNRVRLTSEGYLKLCLYHESGADLRALIRSGADSRGLEKALTSAVIAKPAGHFDRYQTPNMSRIGG